MNISMDKKFDILELVAIIHAYGIVLSSKYDGNIVIENEKNVMLFLEKIIKNSGDYSMKAFDRKAISYRVKKTPVTTHSFYVICSADGIYHTLNFSATGTWAISKGAWAIDTVSDISSYIDYLNGNNRWEVREIKTDNGINTLLTIRNVLSKIRSDVKYHFLSRTDKNDNYDNCNTALLETLVENEFNIVKYKSDRTSTNTIMCEYFHEYL